MIKMKNVFRIGLLSLLCAVFVPSSHAVIIWNWSTTDGISTASGTLTTLGDVSDLLLTGQVFDLVSIDTVSATGGGVTSDPSVAANWNLNDPPPFSDIVIGDVLWDGAFASVGSGGLVALSLVGLSGNTIGIGEAGVTASTAYRIDGGASFYDFIPISTTLTPASAAVPEPGVSIPIIVLALVMGIRRKRSRKQ